ncbi:helix-turn-helix transcriptional regulator [Streptomyces sp. NPDC101151]|uniref:helix-turn-helix transcriptional regulator n=1 Tax=Streptomyces sp. NPDC101151 TaxID=3366115 RepID=UPI00381BE2C8
MDDHLSSIRPQNHEISSGHVFVGRQRELTQLAQVAKEVEKGTPWLVWVQGEAGIGKTTLIRHWLASLKKFTVLTARGDYSESELPFEIIASLLRYVDRKELKRFPLLSKELRAEPATYAVGAELLLLLGDLQEYGPIILVIDDVQWVDPPSIRTLNFLARRLAADRILLVFTSRSGKDSAAASTRRLIEDVDHSLEISLDGLSLDEIGVMAKSFGTDAVQGEVLNRLYAYTHGHPLYARSLLTELAGDVAEARLRVPPSLAAVTRDILIQLPEDSQHLIESLAVLDTRVPLVRAAQVAGVRDGGSALEPALAKGLVEWWPMETSCPVAITHTLQREAIYAGIAPSRRRKLHLAAATVVDANAAWAHRVAAADHVDPELAESLQVQATTEAGRSEWLQAATHLLWAAQLSDNRALYEERLLTACLYSLSTLSETWAARRQEEIETCGKSKLQDCVRGIMAVIRGNTPLAEQLLIPYVAPLVRDTEPVTGAELDWIEAYAAAFLSYAYVLQNRGKDCVDAATRALASNQLSPSMADSIQYILACGHALTDGPRACLKHLNFLPNSSRDVPLRSTEVLTYRGMANAMAGELAQAEDDLSVVIARGKSGAKLRWGMWAYYIQPLVMYMRGSWDDAAIIAERGLSIATTSSRERGMEVAGSHAAACYVSAGRGEWSTANRHLEAAQRKTREIGTALDVLYTSMAEAFMAQASDDASRMLTALEPLWRPADDQERRGYARWLRWWGPLLTEALIKTNALDDAGEVLAELNGLHETAPCFQLPLLHVQGLLAECNGEPDRAIALYEQGASIAITVNEAPLPRARLHQALGFALRSGGRRKEATEWIQQALRGFAALHAVPYADRCRAALGFTLPSSTYRPDRSAMLALSERERDIAVLVGRGMTNNEIAGALLISPKTVEYHLGNIYARFGLTGRRDLRRKIGQTP